MHSTFKSLMIFLAVLAVGTMQVFGVQIGYVCDCTGQKSSKATCQTDECHAVHEASLENHSCAAENESHDHDGKSPCGGGHKHSEVREAPVVTSFPNSTSLPPVVLFDLPPAFQVPEFTMLTSMASARMERLAAAQIDGSPPMPLIVARTMVMRI